MIIGSTSKMGAGTNIQTRLAALHHLDVPWRPADIEQREGRIIRQGNENERVKVFRYVTEGTFDAYSRNPVFLSEWDDVHHPAVREKREFESYCAC